MVAVHAHDSVEDVEVGEVSACRILRVLGLRIESKGFGVACSVLKS